MKNFVIALLLLGLLVGATVLNAGQTKKAALEIEQALKEVEDGADGDNAERISRCSALLEEKRLVLHLSLRHSYIDAMAVNLEEAYAYCLSGDAPSMNASISAALYKIERIKGIESFTLYNML